MPFGPATRRTDLLNEQGPHIFFSPHADDVVLSCGGTIHSLVSQNKPVEVIGVFGGKTDSRYSAYARHLHAKWRLRGNPIDARWREDAAAMNQLGLTTVERWDYLEAPYRSTADGHPLYSTNEQLTGDLSFEDQKLRKQIGQQVRAHLEKVPETAVLYFPLSLGHHVDHQILFGIGLELRAAGNQVHFYEDYPYVEAFKANGQNDWQPWVAAVSLEPKIRAAGAYTSQLRGLGGSKASLEKRLKAFAAAAGNGHAGERFWDIETAAAKKILGPKVGVGHPFVKKTAKIRLRDFRKFLKTFRWHDLDEVLPIGSGDCVDVGCGTGRHKALIEGRGYQWFGFDRGAANPGVGQCDAATLPVQSQSKAAVVTWQVLEYVDRPEEVISEAARILETGGVFCGSVSFLEPIHGRTYFNISPLILEKLLRQHGFADIEIKPGLNGFVLMLWTWLRRSGIPFADRFAIPAALLIWAPLSALVFFFSWLSWRAGFGSGHTMQWLSQSAPLEFAGHVLFSARKKANCTSLS